MHIYGHIYRYIYVNTTMYDRNASFQFMFTNDLDSGFVTADGEFGICIIFMQSWSWRPRIVGSLVSPKGKEQCGDVKRGTHTTELFKRHIFVKNLFSRSFKARPAIMLMCNARKPLLAEPSKNWEGFQRVPVRSWQSCLSTALSVTAEHLPGISYSQNQGEM